MNLPAAPVGAVQVPDGPQQELAELRQRLDRLQLAHHELEAFTAAVAHELRSPLGALGNFCTLLQESLTGLSGDQARSCQHLAQRIELGLQHMGQLIDALLLLSRASTAALRVEPVNLSALAAEVIDSLVARDPGRPHQCTVQPGLQAWGDRALLRQLLENLLGNAWKFSAQQPKVCIEFGQQPPHEGGAFFVRDQGAGFDMAQADRLFQPFERLHDATRFAGTGVGLATVRRIVERHGGRTHAWSSAGAGATFFFTLASGCEPASASSGE